MTGRNLLGRRSNGGLAWAVVLLVSLLLLVAATTVSVASPRPANVQPSATWERSLEPVLLTGSQLTQLAESPTEGSGAESPTEGSGAESPTEGSGTHLPASAMGDNLPIDELFAYAYAGGIWSQIPFQVDEVDAAGTYTVENGLLDDDDELVFMAMDLGEQAAPTEWIADADSQTHPRFEVEVVNPLTPTEVAWAYIYRSATLVPAAGDYVDWDAANNRFVAGTYVLGYAPDAHIGVDSLELNGSGVDALDRAKLRVNITCWTEGFPITMTLTEDNLPVPEATVTHDGPVRAGGGTTSVPKWCYHSLSQLSNSLDLNGRLPSLACSHVDVHWLRRSHDWLNPGDTGMAPATYYDNNTPSGVAIDGYADAVLPTPAAAWREISGGQGSVVQVSDVSLGGTASNYYKDDEAHDPADTGDGRSYGDTGLRVDDPTGPISIDSVTFYLPPDQGNVGATYRAYFDNPLQATVAAQGYPPFCRPGDVDLDWAPKPVHMNAITVFEATVGTGTPPFTYTWTFGDDGSTAGGNPVAHSFAVTGTFPVTVTVGNACGQVVVGAMVDVICEPVTGTDFGWHPAAPDVGERVTFTAAATGTEPISFTWAFGDGAVGAGRVVTHTYALSQTYTVVLTAENACGSDGPVIHAVPVVTPTPAFVYLPLILQAYTPPLPPCDELIEDGGFEDTSAWVIGPTPRPARHATEQAHSGSHSMLLGLKPGEDDLYSYSSVRQAITLTAGVTTTLTFWYYPMSGLDDGDRQECLLLDEQDQMLAILMRTNVNTAAWTPVSIDLSAYAGQAVKVYFNAFNDDAGGGTTGFYLDDVSVSNCPPSLPPPPPPPPQDCYPLFLDGVTVGDMPHGVAVNSAAKRAYVANYDDDTLSVVNSQTYAVIKTVSAGDGPTALAYNPTSGLIYVAARNANAVRVLRASDYALVKTIAVGSRPNGLAVNGVTNRIYVANYGSGTVSVIDGAANKVIQTLAVGSEPAQVAVNPKTNRAYVSLHGAGRVAVIDGAGHVASVDLYSAGPYGIAVDTERNLVYVATIDTFRIVAVDGNHDVFLGWAEIRRMPSAEPVPLRMIAVNPLIGTSGHVFVTTAFGDGGWDRFLVLPKGWPEYFARPYAFDLGEPREGIAFDAGTFRVFATSRRDDLLAIYLDGEPGCPTNLAQDGYQVTVCVASEASPAGTCGQVITRR